MADLDSLKSFLIPLLQPPYSYMAALAATLFVLLVILRRYRLAHRPIVPFKTEGGTIEISPHTLRSVIQGAARSVEGVHKCACRHFVRRQQLGVKVTLQMQANHSLRDIDTAIKERIRAALLEQFGMESVAPIHVRVSRIVGKPLPREHYTPLPPEPAFKGDPAREDASPSDPLSTRGESPS